MSQNQQQQTTYPMNFQSQFNDGLTYRDFLDKYGTEEHKRRWQSIYEQVRLTDEQRQVLQGFQREMLVLVTAGTWCGDCVNQCPIFARFEEVNPRIRVRFFDRDEHPQLADTLAICGAPRVPSVLFLSEDGYVCGRYGDRTLSKYRRMAQEQLGPACPTGMHAPEDGLLEAATQDWLNEFERIQLMLRLSGRLRKLHGD